MLLLRFCHYRQHRLMVDCDCRGGGENNLAFPKKQWGKKLTEHEPMQKNVSPV